MAEGGSEPKIAVDMRRVSERTELHSAESEVIEFVREDWHLGVDLRFSALPPYTCGFEALLQLL